MIPCTEQLSAPDFAALRARAFNLRWATLDADVIPLTAADPDVPIAAAITEAISEYVRVPHLCYGPACGLPAFREAVAKHYCHEKNARVAAGRVIATNSAASALALVARHLLRPGDEVVVQDPVDFLVAESARRAGATLRFWKPTDGHFTAAGLRDAVTARTKLISVCHPHNPMGTLWSGDEVRAIASIAAERGIALLSDEVWSDVMLDDAHFTSFANIGANTTTNMKAQHWVVYGLSKGFGLAGLRIGAVIAPSVSAAREFASAQGFDHTIEGASTISQIAAVAALEHAGDWRAEFLRHCSQQRDEAIARLNALSGVRVERAPHATFVVFVDIRATGLHEEDLAERIERHARVRVVAGSPRWFGAAAAGHIRLSLATTRGVLDEALTRIERAWPVIIAR